MSYDMKTALLMQNLILFLPWRIINESNCLVTIRVA